MSLAENPFTPRREGVPLRLTLDGRSLSLLAAEEKAELDLLMMLGSTPVLDALVLDWPGAQGEKLQRGRVASLDRDRDLRVIEQVGSRGFFGSVQPWSSRELTADQLGLGGAAREWFLYYETVTWFHRNSSRHYFVSADQRLLRERNELNSRWGGRRIIDVRQALAFVGLLMRAREKLYVEANGNYTRSVALYNFYFVLAFASRAGARPARPLGADGRRELAN